MKRTYIALEFDRSFRLRKEWKNETMEDIEEELAKYLQEMIIQSLQKMSLEDFKNYCCKFSHYRDEEAEGIMEGDRVYFV
jgi:hypothetical protein